MTMTLLMQNMLKSNLNRYNLFRKRPNLIRALFVARSFRTWYGNCQYLYLPSFRGRKLLRLALNGYTQIQIEKILFPIMNFRFSPCLEFLPRSQSFGKGTPFQKPQSVRYPAWMPYRNSLCSACRRISCKVNSKPVKNLSLSLNMT